MTPSATQPVEELGVVPLISEAGLLDIAEFQFELDAVINVSDIAQFDPGIQDFLANVGQVDGAGAEATLRAALDPIQTAVDDGTMTPAQVGDFLHWLRFNNGLESLTADASIGANMANYLAAWLGEQGLVQPNAPATGTQPPPTTTTPPPVTTTPPPPVTAPPVPTYPTPTAPAPPLVPNPPPAPTLTTPTVGQQVVTKTVREVVPQTVSVSGADTVTPGQVQQAVSIAFIDAIKAQAAAIDAMLPGMKPNQVPQALNQLNTAVTVLERQLDVLRATTTGHATASLSSQITALQGVVATLQGEIDALDRQMAETDPSGLSEDLGRVKANQATDEGTIAHIEQVLPTLAPLATVTALAGQVGTLQKQMALTEPSPVADAITNADGAANKAQTTADGAQDCCDTTGEALNSDVNDLGGKSLLPNLGKLAARAFEALGIMSLLETIIGIADLPLVEQSIIQDTTVLTEWISKSTGPITADITWAKRFMPS